MGWGRLGGFVARSGMLAGGVSTRVFSVTRRWCLSDLPRDNCSYSLIAKTVLWRCLRRRTTITASGRCHAPVVMARRVVRATARGTSARIGGPDKLGHDVKGLAAQLAYCCESPKDYRVKVEASCRRCRLSSRDSRRWRAPAPSPFMTRNVQPKADPPRYHRRASAAKIRYLRSFVHIQPSDREDVP